MLLMAIVGVMPTSAQKRSMTVTELFDLVESNSKTLQETKTSVEFAQKGIEAARAQRLPDVNASLSASYNGNVVVMDRDFTNAQGFSSPHFGNSFALEAQQVVYAGGAIDAGIRIAELQRDMAQTGHRINSETQRFLALGQYLDLYKIQNRMQVMEQNISLTQRLHDQTVQFTIVALAAGSLSDDVGHERQEEVASVVPVHQMTSREQRPEHGSGCQ